MKRALPSETVNALRILQRICSELEADIVVVGAVAYEIWIEDPWHSTGDVDVAVAIDLADLPKLASALARAGWRRHPRLGHRWFSAEGAIIDIIPAGAKLRAVGKIVWPESDFEMSLAGFDHVFEESISVEIGNGVSVRTITLPVYMLLKIIAYLDRPDVAKHIRDIAAILERYESDSDRRFSNEVLEAGMTYQAAGAYLLGVDVGSLCTEKEAEAIHRFLEMVGSGESRAYSELIRYAPAVQGDNKEETMTQQINAFVDGFRKTREALKERASED